MVCRRENSSNHNMNISWCLAKTIGCHGDCCIIRRSRIHWVSTLLGYAWIIYAVYLRPRDHPIRVWFSGLQSMSLGIYNDTLTSIQVLGSLKLWRILSIVGIREYFCISHICTDINFVIRLKCGIWLLSQFWPKMHPPAFRPKRRSRLALLNIEKVDQIWQDR